MNEKTKDISNKASYIAIIAGFLCLLPILMITVNFLLLFLVFPIMWGLYKWRGLTSYLVLVPFYGAIWSFFIPAVLYGKFFELGNDEDFSIFMILVIGIVFHAAIVNLNSIYSKAASCNGFFYNFAYVLLFGALFYLVSTCVMNYCGCEYRNFSACGRLRDWKYSFIYLTPAAYIALWALTLNVWFTENWWKEWSKKLIWLAIFAYSAYNIGIKTINLPILEQKCAAEKMLQKQGTFPPIEEDSFLLWVIDRFLPSAEVIKRETETDEN